MGAKYATVEALSETLDVPVSARHRRKVLRALDVGSRAVDSLCGRGLGGFWPEVRTRSFDWPAPAYPDPARLWLDEPELVSLTTITSGGTTLDPASFVLYPDGGPPFDHVEVDRSSNTSLGLGDTPQNDVAIAGVWGYDLHVEAAGALSAAVVSSSATTIDVTDSAAVGIGDLLTLGTERLTVTDKRWTDTGQDTTGALADSTAAVSVGVADGTTFAAGEVLLVDSERIRIEDIAGNTLTVERAADGSVLASHLTGASLFAGRRLVVERGAYGTTAATHLIAAVISRHVYPSLVVELAIAEAVVTLQQQGAGWASKSGTGDHTADVEGGGIEALRARCKSRHGRSTRHQAV